MHDECDGEKIDVRQTRRSADAGARASSCVTQGVEAVSEGATRHCATTLDHAAATTKIGRLRPGAFSAEHPPGSAWELHPKPWHGIPRLVLWFHAIMVL